MIKQLLLSCAVMLSTLSHAQQTKIVVPYSPGGGNDTIARLLAKHLSASWKTPVIVDNRPGAGTVIGTEYVAKSNGDGRTLLLSSVAVVATSAHFMENPPYNSRRDLVPVAYMGTVLPMVLVANTQSGLRDVQNLITTARARTLNYGSPGLGNAQHIFGAMLSDITKTNMTHIIYRSGPQATQDLLGGQLDFMFTVPQVILPHIQSGRLTAMAVVADDPYSVLPTVPTMSSLGYKQFAGRDQWFGVWAPAFTPPSVVERLRKEMHQVFNNELKHELVKSFVIDTSSVPPQDLVRDQNRVADRYLQLFLDYNIRP